MSPVMRSKLVHNIMRLLMHLGQGGEETPAPVTCQYYQFKCDDDECIDQRRQCDGRRDCQDGSDEYNCRMYRTYNFNSQKLLECRRS